MKRTILKILAIAAIGLPVTAAADLITVTYDIGEYSAGGYSASWLHGATGCGWYTGPDTGGTLYMCGTAQRVAGSITGFLSGDGVLTILYGNLTRADGAEYDSISGSIGGTGTWSMSIGGLGVFLFEHFYMGSGWPNSFDGTEFVLWGQNEAAYPCTEEQETCDYGDRWGIDLYGVARVPEPGILALFGIGLLGLGLAKRRTA